MAQNKTAIKAWIAVNLNRRFGRDYESIKRLNELRACQHTFLRAFLAVFSLVRPDSDAPSVDGVLLLAPPSSIS